MEMEIDIFKNTTNTRPISVHDTLTLYRAEFINLDLSWKGFALIKFIEYIQHFCNAHKAAFGMTPVFVVSTVELPITFEYNLGLKESQYWLMSEDVFGDIPGLSAIINTEPHELQDFKPFAVRLKLQLPYQGDYPDTTDRYIVSESFGQVRIA